MAVKKTGLGKGLDSMIPVYKTKREESEKTGRKATPQKRSSGMGKTVEKATEKVVKEPSEKGTEPVANTQTEGTSEKTSGKRPRDATKKVAGRPSEAIVESVTGKQFEGTEGRTATSLEKTVNKAAGRATDQSPGARKVVTKESGNGTAGAKTAPVKGIENTDHDVIEMKISMVEPNREQPRKKFDEDALIELADSIKQYGIIQPILVKKRPDYYEIIAGERRWRAAKIAGLKKVPIIVRDFSQQEIVEISLIENIQREDLNPIEEAQAYHRLLDEFHMKQDEIASRVAKSRTTITNSLRLLKLDPKVQEMLVDEMISAGHARALLGLENQEQQVQLAGRIFDEKLSVREVEKLVKILQSGRDKKKEQRGASNTALDYIFQDMEEKMKAILGTKVVVNRKSAARGRIEIEYYSQQELERIYDLLRQIRQ